MKRYLEGDSLNQIWKEAVAELFREGETAYPRGKAIKEIRNFSFELRHPRNRVITHAARSFSWPRAVGELAWYLAAAQSVDFIGYYDPQRVCLSDNETTLNSAYGRRIFTSDHPLLPFNQFEQVKQQLLSDADTRQAIIHLHTPNNQPTKDEVCTLCLQFFIRQNKLEMITTMRSNDIVLGTTYDVFFFTILQEMLAEAVGVEIGSYYHHAGSMHLYEKDFKLAQTVMEEDDSSCGSMQPLRQFQYYVPILLELEQQIRTAESFDIKQAQIILSDERLIESAWRDLILVLVKDKLNRVGRAKEIQQLEDFFHVDCV